MCALNKVNLGGLSTKLTESCVIGGALKLFKWF